MTSRDRVKAVFEGEPVDRVPRVDYYWGETACRWKNEGLSFETPEELQYIFDQGAEEHPAGGGDVAPYPVAVHRHADFLDEIDHLQSDLQRTAQHVRYERQVLRD